MKCSNCSTSFSLTEHLPWILLCGHIICEPCTKSKEGVPCIKCSTVGNRALTYDHYLIGLLYTEGHFPITLSQNRSLLENTIFCSSHPRSVVQYVDEDDESLHCEECIRDHTSEDRHISTIEASNQSHFSELNALVDSMKAIKSSSLKASEKKDRPHYLSPVNQEFHQAHTLLQVKRVKTLLMIMEQNPVMRVFDNIVASNEFMQSCGGLPESGFAAKLIKLAKNVIPPSAEEEAAKVPMDNPFVKVKVSEPEVNVNHNLHKYYFENKPKGGINNVLGTGEEVRILSTISPSAIFVRKAKEDPIYTNMNRYVGEKLAPGGVHYVKEGNMYATRHDKIWYRVVILNHRSDMPQVRVAFVDIGEIKFISIESLRCFTDTKEVGSIQARAFLISLSSTKNARYQQEQVEQFQILAKTYDSYWLDHIQGDEGDEYDLLYIGSNGCLNSLRDVCIQEKIISFKSGYQTNSSQMPKKRIHWNEIVVPDLTVQTAADSLKEDSKSNSKVKLNNDKKRTRKKKNNGDQGERPSSRNSDASSTATMDDGICTFKI
eukprot:TRINITY_DN4130_c0_g1_i1.p1 TRINITY_DN4130_c0_g1~~TRINITY_DN4130_c0_g1_i1.p1  ORF type:complete len:546 (-),score=197.41 TRINITY_DN4130_c0_g1_i1:100-1737(-)